MSTGPGSPRMERILALVGWPRRRRVPPLVLEPWQQERIDALSADLAEHYSVTLPEAFAAMAHRDPNPFPRIRLFRKAPR